MFYKQLYTRKEGGSPPQLIIAQTENMQSRYVVQRILELREEGVPLQDQAVLFRSSFHSFDLEVELAKANIPFVKYGGYKFIETSHVKDMVAYLRVLANPRDVVAWNRILLLLDGVGPRTSEKIINDISQKRINAAEGNAVSTSFWSQFQNYPEKVRGLFEALREAASNRRTPGEKSYHMLQYYEPLMKSRYDDYQKRKKDIETFQNITERYESIEQLLTDMALEPPNESVSGIESPGKETEFLTLSTIHSAKGLEWHSVFVIYVLEGRFPTFRAAASEEEMEEERRLMYVACTRAKENLFITYPANVYDRESGLILTKPSRFIDDIDKKLLEPWVIQEEDA